jgi:hypothetical protein
VSIVSPANGATYLLNETLSAYYSCVAAAGLTIISCTGTTPNGGPVDTSTAGSHTFTVTAADSAGINTVVTSTYKVEQATPSISTRAQPSSAIVGSSVADQATVSGGDNPTGTVTFNLHSSATVQNSSTLLFTDTESLAGGVATSAAYKPKAAGTDYWVATYSGDTNNKSVTSGTASEPVKITPGPNSQGQNNNNQGQNHNR